MANGNDDLGMGPATTSPQPSRDPAYQPGLTTGGTDPGTPPPNVRPPAGTTGGPVETFGDGAPAFVGYPLAKYHPVYGRREAKDPNEAAQIFQPPHNWFETPANADAARTEREAQQVIHHNLNMKVADKLARVNDEQPPQEADPDRKAIVRNSVQAQESLDSGHAEPL